MNPLIYKCFTPFSKFCAKNQKLMLSIRYWKEFKKLPSISNPVYFHEKLFYLACNEDTTLWTQLADKYEVRKYVAEKYGEQILNELYGVWNKADEIDYKSLPDRFVIKANNGCASVIIVKDKSKLDIDKANANLNYWLKLRFGDISGQCHYSAISPKIIAEKLLVQDGDPNKMLVDYKISCFNGVPEFVSVFSDRTMYTHQVNEMLYDMDWHPHPEWYDEKNPRLHEANEIPCPVCWEEMKEIARRLSAGFKYVRVDLYVIDDKPIFGELTFTPGLNTYYSNEFQKHLGDMIQI